MYFLQLKTYGIYAIFDTVTQVCIHITHLMWSSILNVSWSQFLYDFQMTKTMRFRRNSMLSTGIACMKKVGHFVNESDKIDLVI